MQLFVGFLCRAHIVESPIATQNILHNLLKVVRTSPLLSGDISVNDEHASRGVGPPFRAAAICFCRSPFVPARLRVSAECGCHKALGSMRLGMFHLISLTSPVSGGAERRQAAGGEPGSRRQNKAD